MKQLLICMAGGFLAFAGLQAQLTETTTTTVTTSNGTITEYVPGSTFILKETSGPVTYTYGPSVIYATHDGIVLTPEQVKARIRAGIPVRVEYAPQGETRIIRRIIVDEKKAEKDD